MPDQPKISRSSPVSSGKIAGARESEAEGFVLAGGKSSRMGRDKALLPFAGRPLVGRALGVLSDAGLNASIAGARALLESFAPVVKDSQPGLGPLSGICAALHGTSARWAVFIPVDLPLLPASLVAFLLRHAQTTERAITVPAVSGFTHTFPAILDRAVLPVLEAELKAGRRGCFSAFKVAAAALGQQVGEVEVELAVQSGQIAHPAGLPAVHWFLNVNAPEDRERAEALSRHRHALGTLDASGIPDAAGNPRAQGL